MRFDRPIAHRGFHDRATGIIENSRSAFFAAVERGYAIECDLQLTSDGEPVIIHDPETERLLGRKGRVREMSAAEITRIPLVGSSAGDCPEPFSALLELVSGRVLLQVELKQQKGSADTNRLARAAARLAAAYDGPLVFESFDPLMIMAMRRHGYKGQIGIISERYTGSGSGKLNPFQRFFMRHLLHAPFSRFDFLSIDLKALDLPMVRLFRGMGRQVTCWTVRSAEEAQAAFHGGADQIVFEGFDPDAELGHDSSLSEG